MWLMPPESDSEISGTLDFIEFAPHELVQRVYVYDFHAESPSFASRMK
jgi:hypothetical protein